jgi:hypothetical protein
VRVKATFEGTPTWQERHISAQNAFNSQNMLNAHFGLGDAPTVDSLVVQWPSGQVSVLTGVSTNQFLDMEEDVPAGFLRASFVADSLFSVNAESLTVQFTNLSVADPGQPITLYSWDFENDGSIDNQIKELSWSYTKPGTYSVSLVITNGTSSDTLVAEDYITIVGPVAFPFVNTEQLNLGAFDANVQRADTSFTVFNYGRAADSINVSIDTANVSPAGAMTVSPSIFALAPGDSQLVMVSVFPSQLNTPYPFLYNPNVLIDSHLGYGTTHFEKPVSFRVTGTVDVGEEDGTVPAEFALGQNYPNPFNPTTRIRYQLPVAGDVRLTVYDVLGSEVAVLVDEKKGAGYHTAEFNADGLASGLYLYELTAGTFVQTRKMLLVR